LVLPLTLLDQLLLLGKQLASEQEEMLLYKVVAAFMLLGNMPVVQEMARVLEQQFML
jgi:hypothetical protein